ncbi:hypothetical protein PISL3812_06581 [Talaromyces islandicus]|uniref:Uncharacterized protein n=1 Tax=Talaromyces islandicus TaxID=28573 RepID=A0A0U1M1U4_TALIS|nr:hypothetical protein PISL3812_06581 [Talaromyces islandicus]
MAEAIKRAFHSLNPENSEETPTQQTPSQAGKKQTEKKKSEDISSMPVEKQFETDYDKAGNLVPDPVHFDKEHDMVKASLDDFIEHH